MFQRSGPGHMLLHTEQKKMVQDRISLSLPKVKVKVKVKFGTKGHMCKSLKGKIEPLRGNSGPPQTRPSPPSSSWPLLAE